MQIKKIILTLALVSLAIAPIAVFAQPSTTISSIDNLIDSVKTMAWTVFGGLAVIMFVVAGIMFLTAQGDPEKVKSARNAFIWGVVGVVVAIMAYSIISIVESAL